VKESFTHNLLISEGYKLSEDAWDEHGRRTYLHDDIATREYFMMLAVTLRRAGWETGTRRRSLFNHRHTGEIIEIEPGGSETTGHFLHHMKRSAK
jgi:hypothetical protein